MNYQNMNVDNMNIENFVKHEGIISKISNNVVTVSLKGNINCKSCGIKSACGISDSTSKEVEIVSPDMRLTLNESVYVILKKDLGLKAIFWAYVLPFILMLTMLIVAAPFVQEWLAGLLAVSFLIPYYLILYVLRGQFRKIFKISILKTT
jgi:sigma-E factor negative regulatory protein RseC